MSRSVSVPYNAVNVVHAAFECEEPEFASEDFGFCIEDMQEVAKEKFPSLSPCDRWVGREDHAVLENNHAYVGVSEYCGLVAVWVVPKGDSPLAEHWASQINIEGLAACFGQGLRKCGTASNGEAFFQPKNGVQKGAMGLGYTSKEGWL